MTRPVPIATVVVCAVSLSCCVWIYGEAIMYLILSLPYFILATLAVGFRAWPVASRFLLVVTLAVGAFGVGTLSYLHWEAQQPSYQRPGGCGLPTEFAILLLQGFAIATATVMILLPEAVNRLAKTFR